MIAQTARQRLAAAQALLHFKNSSGFQTVGATVVIRSEDPTNAWS